jgi:Ca2+-binding RTX toxin-like protein
MKTLKNIYCNATQKYSHFTNSLVFIDSAVDDYQTLVKGVIPGVEVRVLDPTSDGVAQITEALAGRIDISAVHIVSHGSPGCLYLGNTQLNLDTVEYYASQVQTWFSLLTPCSLILYGCNVARGNVGEKFVERLHQLTGTNIAASAERVGNTAKGGNWHLEHRYGEIGTSSAFVPELMQVYSGVFANLPDSTIKTLLSGNSWGKPKQITFSFYEDDVFKGKYYGKEKGVKEVSDAVKDNVRAIMNWLETIINVDFVEVTEKKTKIFGVNFDVYGQIRYMVSNDPKYAYAHLPSSKSIGGDVHLSPQANSDFAGGLGSDGYEGLLHETLHALGLKHPGDYDSESGKGTPPFLPFAEDNNTNTLMSYNSFGSKAVTPMPYDIQALQKLYGAKAYNTGDTTYSFTSAHSYKVNGQSVGSSNPRMKLTIWDSGGIDTLDFSALYDSSGYWIDLREGQISTTRNALDGTSYTAKSDTSGATYTTSTFGTAIAFNTVIENAKGSIRDDFMIGNDVANNLDGGIGSDFLIGFSGDDYLHGGFYGKDTLYGGNGNDALYGWTDDDYMSGGEDNDYLDGWEGNDTLSGDGGNDVLVAWKGNDLIYGGDDNDWLDGSYDNDTLYGGKGDDTLGNSVVPESGDDIMYGQDGNDQLYGGEGNDFLVGDTLSAGESAVGNDTLNGGDNNDSLYGGRGNDSLMGGDGNDFLSGTFSGSTTDLDIFTGGAGADLFSLGYNSSFGAEIHYLGAGYATITDFNRWDGDRIRIGGSSSNYRLENPYNYGNPSVQDTTIYLGSDLIAIVQDTTDLIFA